jgi:predicted metal-binding membrane protein
LIQGVRSLDLSWLAWDDGGQYVAGGVILGAALYELTPIKSRCLRYCRDPEALARRPGSLLTGLQHGCFCVGSSWALMGALFALGVMNLAWMIVVAALVAVEKLLPWEGLAIGATAVVVAAVGLGVALAPGHVPGLTIPM